MKLTFVELNEFNKQLLKTCAELFDLKSVKKLVSMQESETYTDDTYESDYLEPWVQWVCVHTGSLSKHHGIKHLGDVPCLTTPQIWEKLSSMGYSSIIWGAMNADRKESDKNLVFLPDPWTSNERAFPEELNKLLDPLRAVSTNYLKPDKVKIMKMMKSLMGLFKDKELLKELIFELPSLLKELITFKKAHFVFIAFTEYFSTKLFLKYKKQLNPDFSLIFINSLAHIQHHHWKGFDYENNLKLKLGLEYIDKMLKAIFDALDENEVFLLANALSQKNTNDEDPWILYRPLNHQSFLTKIGINPKKIQEHMTHDAHLFFETSQQCLKAKAILEKARVENRLLFLVESYKEDPLKLFYRLQFTDKIAQDALIDINQQKVSFFSFFQTIVERTGKHTQQGTCYCNLDVLPKHLYNYELYNQIINLFSAKKLELLESSLVDKN